MGTSKQDWTIWVRNPQPFSRYNRFERTIEEAVETVYKTVIDYQAVESHGYHVVTVRHATQAMSDRIALTIQAIHLQRMHETQNYSASGWCSFEIRPGRSEESIPQWIFALDDAWARRMVQALPSEITIFQAYQEKHEDAFWYTGEVARTERYILFATQEVSCRFKEEGNPDESERFHNEEARQEARDRKLTDANLARSLHWYWSNWFEIRDLQKHQLAGSRFGSWTEGMRWLTDLVSHDKDQSVVSS